MFYPQGSYATAVPLLLSGYRVNSAPFLQYVRVLPAVLVDMIFGIPQALLEAFEFPVPLEFVPSNFISQVG